MSLARPREPHSGRRTKMVIASGAVVLVILGCALLATAPSRDAPSHSSLASGSGVRYAAEVRVRLPTGGLLIRTISPLLRRSFAIFRDRPNSVTARASDSSTFETLVPRILTRWHRIQAAVLGHASDQNVEVMAADGTQVAVLAGSGGACMAAATVLLHGSGGYGAVCESASEVAERGLGFTVETSAGISRVVGIVPNGNGNVEVTFASGQTESVPVVSNVFNVSATGGSPIKAVSYATSGGDRTSIQAG